MGMKLDELQGNEKLHIEVTLQNGKLEYEVEVLFIEKGIVFIEPIRYNNQIINFMKRRWDIKIDKKSYITFLGLESILE